ncbi:MAG TPA: hypothetical protein PJ986_12800 [Gammaproteobacteria bacterium]|nr:hypothetical protein [Gammaproteobacteria bacterium]
MKTTSKARSATFDLKALLLGFGLAAAGGAAAADFQGGRKISVTVLPTGDRTMRVAVADARQVAGDVKVRVRIVRQGIHGPHRAHTVRLAVVNDKGVVEHSDMRRISQAALQRRGAGYRWLTLSLSHEMTAGDTLVLSLGPAPAA